MRIVHVVFSGRYSGAEILARDLALNQCARGFGVDLIAVEPGEPSFQPEIARMASNGIDFHAPGGSLGNGIARTLFLSRTLRRIAPDIVIAHSILPSLYCRGAKLLGAKFRLTTVLHSINDYEDQLLLWAERISGHMNAAVIGVCPEACSHYRKAVAGKREPHWIPNGIDLDRFVFEESARHSVRRDTYGAGEDDFVFLQVGRLNEVKQQLLTLSAVNQVADHCRIRGKIFLVFVGPEEAGPYSQQFRDAISRPCAEGLTVCYLGARADVAKLLQGADLALMPSTWEAHSVAALEAVASGVRLVISDIDAFAAIARLEGTFSFRSGDMKSYAAAIINGLRTGLNIRFQRNLEEFSIATCSQRYLEVAAGTARPCAQVHFDGPPVID